ncbi:MAG: chorismate synthase [Proteobacteria bacterium]|uniref:Chorismate synthase n=1 Tax=SAR86 cluster bacterium TaxID=2030880 RepID=A0A937ICU3_9GAMM|nr:chorismate synthase [SAR86 cluster bacterium]MBL6820131.1 chorismate synthase [SAR86 cluster bacterium]MDA0345164.1 chorismate synthase [Pseudomonadota bacterium]MDA0900268.1 chorismate synthase [Pseudomonadota bacterium]MDA1056220.1 chorismate synthase [Pseudomonadota bacterium]
MSGNTFGTIFKLSTFGESHGIALGAIIDGCPPNIPLTTEDIQDELDRRKPGQSRYVTQRKEDDAVEILSGVFEGKTTGTPIGLIIKNKDQKSKDYEDIKDKFRPGHADYTYQQKYGIRDYRGGGRASARETAMRVAGGAIAKKILATLGISISAGVVQIGEIRANKVSISEGAKNDFNFVDLEKISELETFFQALNKEQDSVGAKILVRVAGLMPGVGSPVFSKLDAELAKAMMSVNAVKAVEIGAGTSVVEMKGSENRDLMVKAGFLSNNSGGIIGGISNGEDIDLYVSLKPTSSISQKTTTVNKDNEEVDLQVKGRHDPCVGLRAVPILEAMAALTILDQYLLDKGQCFNIERS